MAFLRGLTFHSTHTSQPTLDVSNLILLAGGGAGGALGGRAPAGRGGRAVPGGARLASQLCCAMLCCVYCAVLRILLMPAAPDKPNLPHPYPACKHCTHLPPLQPPCLPTSCQVITLSDDHMVRVWDLRNHKCVQAIGKAGGQAACVGISRHAFDREGRELRVRMQQAGWMLNHRTSAAAVSRHHPWQSVSLDAACVTNPRPRTTTTRLGTPRGLSPHRYGLRHEPAAPGVVSRPHP